MGSTLVKTGSLLIDTPEAHGSVQLYHLRINNLSARQCLQYTRQVLATDSVGVQTIYFLNAHCFNLSLRDEQYKDALHRSSLLLNDGIGIKIASRLKGIELLENMNGTDFIPRVVQNAAQDGIKVYLLGAGQSVIEKAVARWRERFPGLNIVGFQSGYFDVDDDVVDNINRSEAELLIVGMGVPKQEVWLQQHRHRLTSVKVAFAGGAIFDFAAGKVVRAPAAFQRFGLEWCFRLLQEPRRLFHRYMIGNLAFLAHVISYRKREQTADTGTASQG